MTWILIIHLASGGFGDAIDHISGFKTLTDCMKTASKIRTGLDAAEERIFCVEANLE